MKTPKLLALALAAALALPSHAPAQARQQGPIFGTGIEIINLSLSVTDARNNFVTDLGQKDFAVFEDGIRQDLSLFTHENLPISMVLMIDTSASMEEKLKNAQDAAIRFSSTSGRRRCRPSRTISSRSRGRSARPRPRARRRSTTRSTSRSRT